MNQGDIARALAALLSAGCAPDAPPIAVPEGARALVNAFDWTPLDPAQDPFRDRPAGVDCPPESWGGEPFGAQYALEVQTGPGGCGYFSAAQPLLSAVGAGEPIRVRVWHFALDAPTRGEAHVAVALDGEVIWQRWVVVPAAEGALLLDTVVAPRTLPAGAPLVFHLHNHGANTWNLLDVVASPDPEPPPGP